MRVLIVTLVASALWACSDVSPSEVADSTGQAQSSLDTADRSCSVALRSAERATSNGSAVTHCVSGRCWVVWSGFVDVAKATVSQGGQAFVMFHSQSSQSWQQVAATPITSNSAAEGFVRSAFRLDHDTMEVGLSSTGIARTRIELAPFWQTSSGDRLFDKQRGQGDYDNYVLSADNQFTIVDDAKVCPGQPVVAATLDFHSGWVTEQHGALVSGGSATLRFAIDRLPGCRDTHNGYPAWDIRAQIRFWPSGQLIDGSVVGFDGPTPNNSTAHGVPFTFHIPNGSTHADVWFSNFSVAGNSCQAWDSNNGSNYGFEVEPAPFKPVGWQGNLGSSFARDCTRRDGVADPAVMDDYVQQRACAFVEIDTYVPGLTDDLSAERPNAVFARALTSLDGAAQDPTWLSYSGRTGNNYRYRYTVPKSALYYGPKWSTFTYTLQTSSDGLNWVSETPHVILRDKTFCNPAWASCD